MIPYRHRRTPNFRYCVYLNDHTYSMITFSFMCMHKRFLIFSLFTISEESHCVLEMVTSTVTVFTITFISILIANILITCLFVRHQKKKFIEQLQAINEAIPEGKRYVKPQVMDKQGKQSQIAQYANNVRLPANASLPYYNIVRPNNQTSVHLERNPAYK